MKKFTLVTGIVLLSIGLFAQYSNTYKPPKGWGSPELFIPTATIISTFAINQAVDMSMNTRNKIAATGMITSVVAHFIFKKIRIKNKTNKKLITLKF